MKINLDILNKKIITICLFLVFSSFAQEKDACHKNDLELKGKVKSLNYQYIGNFKQNYTYFFDRTGKVVKFIDYNDDGTEFEKRLYFYNQYDSIAKKKIINFFHNKNYTISYQYNSKNKLIKELYSNGEYKKVYHYDKKENLIKRERFTKEKDSLFKTIEAILEYDKQGRVSHAIYPDANFGFKYDKEGRLLEEIRYIDYTKLKVFFKEIYKYDKEGRLVKYVGEMEDIIYKYKDGKLVEEIIKDGGYFEIVEEGKEEHYIKIFYNYDNKGNLIEQECRNQKGEVKRICYTYDKHQNYIKKEGSWFFLEKITPLELRTFEYYED